MPVGEGAIRVRTGRSGIELEGAGALGGSAEAAPLSTRLRRAASLRRAWATLRDQAEVQADRWTLWTPVAFGAGCAAYFGLLREPLAWVAWVMLAAGLGLLVVSGRWVGRRAVVVALALTGFAFSGFAVAKLRTESVAAPVAPPGARPQVVEGWVLDIAPPGEGGQRLLIAPVRIGAGCPQWLAAIRRTLRFV